jgi:ribosome-associated protein
MTKSAAKKSAPKTKKAPAAKKTASAPIKKKAAPAVDRSMELALEAARSALDKKAENVRILDLSTLSGFTDYFVICSATNDRQVQSVADAIDFALKKKDARVIAQEGYQEARWVLLDYGDIVVHVFLDASASTTTSNRSGKTLRRFQFRPSSTAPPLRA